MPNEITNNMADTIHQLEEDRIMLNTQLTDLQLAYNEQMIELREAKRLLKQAVDNYPDMTDMWRDKVNKILNEQNLDF